MPTIECPLEGFDKITVTYPDEWLMRHVDLFHLGFSSAPEDASPATKEMFGTVALCEKIEGLDLDDISAMPLSYRPFFNWLVETVFIDGYVKALTVPNGS
jgi:hypothetical protein